MRHSGISAAKLGKKFRLNTEQSQEILDEAKFIEKHGVRNKETPDMKR